MKTARFLLSAALLLGLTGLLTAGTTTVPPAKQATYAVVGYYPGTAVPAPALVQKAMDEIKPRMDKFLLTMDWKKADQIVNVLFEDGRYEINYHSSLDRVSNWVDRMEFDWRVANMQNDQGMPAASMGRGK